MVVSNETVHSVKKKKKTKKFFLENEIGSIACKFFQNGTKAHPSLAPVII